MKLSLPVLLAAAVATPAAAQLPDKKPEFAFSAAGVREGRTIAGPLYKKVEADFAKVARDGQSAFDKLVVGGANLQYYPDLSAGPSAKSVFSAETVKVMTQSCIGPYPYDEAATWVQLSWVCRTASETPFSKLVKFRDSPEFSLTIWFENGLIKELRGMEPLPVPGAKRFMMGAADQVPEGR